MSSNATLSRRFLPRFAGRIEGTAERMGTFFGFSSWMLSPFVLPVEMMRSSIQRRIASQSGN